MNLLMKIILVGNLVSFQAFAQQQPAPQGEGGPTLSMLSPPEIIEQKVIVCLPHFDLRPFLKAALGAPLREEEKESFAMLIGSLFVLGEIILTEEQASDPDVVACVNFAEGLFLGGILNTFPSEFYETMYYKLEQMKAMGSFIEELDKLGSDE